MTSTEESPIQLLRQAVETGRIDVLRSLLSELAHQNNLAVVDSIENYGETLLHFAVEAKNADAVRTILSSGANPCVSNKNGKTAVQLCDSPDIDAVFHQELLQAVAHSKMGRVCQLLACGIPIDVLDSPITRNSVLHWAASFGNSDIIKILCEGGANVNARNAVLDTPLLDAVKRGDPEIVESLLKYGADVSLSNAKNEDAFVLAKMKNPKIADLLNQHMVSGGPMKRFASNDSLSVENSHHSNGPMSPTDSHQNHRPFDGKASKCLNGNPFNLAIPADFMTITGADSRDVTDTLWPRPQKLRFLGSRPALIAEAGAKIRVLLRKGISHELSAAILSKWEPVRSFLKSRGYQLDLQDPFVEMTKNVEGTSVVVVNCTINEAVLQQKEGYKLLMLGDSICHIIGTCLIGLQYGVITFVQLLVQQDKKALPSLMITDWSSVKYRGIQLNTSVQRRLTPEAVLQMAFNIFMLKGNLLLLDYHEMSLHRMEEVEKLIKIYKDLSLECHKLGIFVGLSLEAETSDEQAVVHSLVSLLERLPRQAVMHCGPTMSALLLSSSVLRTFLQNSVQLVLTGQPASDCNFDHGFTRCVPYSELLEEDCLNKCFAHLGSTCLTVSASFKGSLAVPPDELIILSERLQHLCSEVNPMAVVCYDIASSTDHLIVSNMQIFPYHTELLVLGKGWNCAEDGCCVLSALPLILAQYRFGDFTMAPLFEQTLIIGHIEYELAKAAKFRSDSLSEIGRVNVTSIFYNLLRDPNSVALDNLSAITFKRVRMELSKCQQRLTALKSEMPYNFEMALSLGEVQLMLNLSIWAARLGQSLCQIGTNPKSTSGSHVVNVGVSNLSHTTKTDLANKLIELRGNFHHIWLSRNDQSTLEEAVKIFDNILAVLLPQNLHRYQHSP